MSVEWEEKLYLSIFLSLTIIQEFSSSNGLQVERSRVSSIIAILMRICNERLWTKAKVDNSLGKLY